MSITTIDTAHLTWITPPTERGQIVSAAYADLRDGRVLRRIVDRSDLSVSYAVADLDPDGLDEPSGLNGHPSVDSSWIPCQIE